MDTRLRFPSKLKALLEETTEEDGIYWSSSGTEFCWIIPPDGVSPDCSGKLMKYFHHKSPDAIRRQLNLYGFRRNRASRTYVHPNFTRYGDISRVVRRSTSNSNLYASGRVETPRRNSSSSLASTRIADSAETANEQEEVYSDYELFLDTSNAEDGRDEAVTSPFLGNHTDPNYSGNSSPLAANEEPTEPTTHQALRLVNQLDVRDSFDETPFTISGFHQDIDRDIIIASAGLLVKWEGRSLPTVSLLRNTPALMAIPNRGDGKLAFLDTSNLASGSYTLRGHSFEVTSASSLHAFIRAMKDPIFHSTVSMRVAFESVSRETCYTLGEMNANPGGDDAQMVQAVVSKINEHFADAKPNTAGLVLHDGRIVFSFNVDADGLFFDEGFVQLMTSNATSQYQGYRREFSVGSVSVRNKFGFKLDLNDFALLTEKCERMDPQLGNTHIHTVTFTYETMRTPAYIPLTLEQKVVSELRFYRGLGFFPATEMIVRGALEKYLTLAQRTSGSYMVYDLMMGTPSKPVCNKHVQDDLLVPLPRLLPILANPSFYCNVFWMEGCEYDHKHHCSRYYTEVRAHDFSHASLVLVSERRCRIVLVVLSA